MIQEERNTVERVMQAAQRQIWVTFEKEGIHCYPAAATDPKLCTAGEYDVSFWLALIAICSISVLPSMCSIMTGTSSLFNSNDGSLVCIKTVCWRSTGNHAK